MGQSISVFGLGYVGSVSATCLASKGNRVLGVDVNAAKVHAMDSGQSPIVEAGLGEILAQANKACHLHATTSATAAVHQTDISFICVGTPSLRNGKLDLSGVERVCQDIGEALRTKNTFHSVVLRSTVLPGTTDNVVLPVLERASGKKAGSDFAICYNPEFLREGTAMKDFFHPPFTVLGARDISQLEPLRKLYAFANAKVFETSVTTAEMVKYVCNAFHAVKVGFANEVGVLAKQLGVDTEEVTKIFTSDTSLNISPAYLSPGFAFGGSCLPKDLRALVHCAKQNDLRVPLLESILPSNTEHIERVVENILRIGRRKVGVLGLSFKAGTDDLRESPIIGLVRDLWQDGVDVLVHDPDVQPDAMLGSNREYLERQLPQIHQILRPHIAEVLHACHVVVVSQKRPEFTAALQTLNGRATVLDLVRLNEDPASLGVSKYRGMSW